MFETGVRDENSELVSFLVALGERWVDTGVPGLLRFNGRLAVGDSRDVLCVPVGLGPDPTRRVELPPFVFPLPPIVNCCRFGSAGEFRPDAARGDGSERFEVGLLGEAGFGLGIALGTLADLVV